MGRSAKKREKRRRERKVKRKKKKTSRAERRFIEKARRNGCNCFPRWRYFLKPVVPFALCLVKQVILISFDKTDEETISFCFMLDSSLLVEF